MDSSRGKLNSHMKNIHLKYAHTQKEDIFVVVKITLLLKCFHVFHICIRCANVDQHQFLQGVAFH